MNQKKKLVPIVCIIAIVAITCAMVFSFELLIISNNVASVDEVNANVSNTSWGPNGAGAIGYVSNGDGLEDGSVPSRHTGSGTAISNATDLSNAFRNNTGLSYYLTTNIIWSPSVVTDDKGTFSGIIDGCGYSITISASASGDNMTSDHAFGFLTGYFNGELKNATINISLANYTRDRLRNGTLIAGILGHTSTGGKLTNVKVQYSNSETYFTNIYLGYNWNEPVACAGLLFGLSKSSTLTNVTIELNKSFANYSRVGGTSGSKYIIYGVVAGWMTTGATTITNLTIRGSGYVDHVGYNSSGQVRIGGIVGEIKDSGSLSIDGFDLGGWTGKIETDSSSGYAGFFVGTGSATISNVLYSSSSNYTGVTTAGGKNLGGNETITVSNPQEYTCAESEIGFCHSDSLKVWIGQLSSYSGSETNTTGNYVDTVTIGDTKYGTSEIAAEGTELEDKTLYKQTIPIIHKKYISGTIDYSYEGIYVYASNEANTLYKTSGPDLACTNDSTGPKATGTYNGQVLKYGNTHFKLKMRLYNGGYQYVDSSYGLLLDSFEITGGDKSKLEDGYIVNAGSYSLAQTAASSGELLTYTINEDGTTAIIDYNGDGNQEAADAAFARVYMIYNATYTIDVIVDPAEVVFDAQQTPPTYIYTGNILYNGTSMTTEGENFINALIRAYQKEPSKKLDYVALINTDAIGYSFTIPLNQNNIIQNAATYSITITPGSNVSASGNFTIPDSTTFDFTINPLTFDYDWNIADNKVFDDKAINPWSILNVSCNNLFDSGEITSIIVNALATTSSSIVITSSQGVSNTININLTNNYEPNASGADFDNLNILNAGTYKVSFNNSGDSNISSCSEELTYIINQAKLLITFDDTKILYDSILDSTTIDGLKYYDFIYVSGDSRISNFADNYAKYFTNVTFFENGSRGEAKLFKDYLKVDPSQYTKTTESDAVAVPVKFAWLDSVSSTMQNNYVISPGESNYDWANFITTGASKSTSINNADGVEGVTDYDYGEDEISSEGTAFVRILFIKKDPQTETTNSSGYTLIDWNVDYSSIDLFNYIKLRYYDEGILAKKTTYILSNNLYLNRPTTGGRILPSYKTIDGDGVGIYYDWLGGESDEIVGYSEAASTSTPLTNGGYNYSTNSNKFNNEYRGYSVVNGTKYYGAGALLAVNYGTLQNIFFYTFRDRDKKGDQSPNQFINVFTDVNTALGTLVGINCGIIGTYDSASNSINSVEVYQGRQQFIFAKENKDLAYGLICGANNGTMNYVYAETMSTIQDYGASDQEEYPSVALVGEAKSLYFGIISGINGGTIQNLSYRSRYDGLSGANTSTGSYAITATAEEGTSKDLVIYAKSGSKTWSFEKYNIVTTATTHYMGGVTGYNLGKIFGANVTNKGIFASTSGTFAESSCTGANNVYLGGIAGYNKGNGDWASGVIQNCSFRNESQLIATTIGASTYTCSYAVGGIAGVTNAGKINSCGFTNIAGSLIEGRYVPYYLEGDDAQENPQVNATGLYVGGLVGVGCEEGTVDASHLMIHNGETISEGKLLDCTSFNFATFSAQHGGWGYIAGRYNTILSGSDGSQPAEDTNVYDYVHRYGNLIWYTNNTPTYKDEEGNVHYYQKKIFDGIAGIMGVNTGIGDGSDNVYITGLAGIGISDCGDGSIGSAMLDSISLNGDTITVAYKGPNTLGYTGYQAMDATIALEDGTQKAIKINSKDYETSLATNGLFTFSSEDANAIIYSTNNPASTCDVLVRLYVSISTDAEFKSFIGDSTTAGTAPSQSGNFVPDNSRGTFNKYLYCAGYGVLAANLTINTNQVVGSSSYNQAATNIVFSSKKTLRGRSFNYNNYTVDIDAETGEVNRGFSDGGTSYSITYIANGESISTDVGSEAAKISNGSSTTNIYSVGNLVGRNEGTIEYMTVIIDPSWSNYSSNHQSIVIQANTYVAFGVLCGINHGTLKNNVVQIACNYGARATSSSGTTLAFVGGLCGINDRGTIENNQVEMVSSANYSHIGNIYVASTNYSTSALSYGIVGGAIGLSNGGTINGLTVKGLGSVHTNKTLFTYANVGGVVGYMPLVDDLGLAGFNLLKVSNFGSITVALTGGVECWNSIRGGSGLVFGKCITSISQAEESSLIEKIFNANITAVCLGDVDAFQVSGRYENSLYGVVDDYSKDQSATLSREKYSMAKAINRIILQDGSEYGQGYKALVSTLNVTCTNNILTRFEIILTWSSSTTEHVIEKLDSYNIATIPNISETSVILPNIDRSSSSNAYYIKINIKYTVNIAGESIVYNDANSLKNSPMMNFVAGRGNLPIYAGATTGNLQGNVTYDKKVTSAIEMTSRKTLNGGGYSFIANWIGETDNQIAGITEDTSGAAFGDNKISNVGEYPKWYEGVNGTTTIKVYGISDFVSINRGTINNLKVVTRENASQHYYNGLIGNGANVAYGSFCGVNLGTITNCLVELKSPTAFTYNSQESTCDLLVSPGVGLNRGTIDTFNISMNNSYTITGIAKNVTIGGAVALNGVGSTLKNAEVTINGSFNRNIITYDSTNDLLKDNTEGAVVFGGIVGVNDGGAVQYTKISGTGTINVSNTSYDISGVETITGKDEQGNDVEIQVEKSRLYEDTKYMFFAMGIAISNNISGTVPVYGGHAIHDCVDGTTNKVHDMIIQFNGSLFYTIQGNYMLGLAFATASTTTAGTDSSPAYKNIFITNNYSSYSELVYEGGYRTGGFYNGYVIGAALPLMGHVDTEVAGDTDFVVGGRIEANAVYELSFGADGTSLVIQSNDANISKLTAAYIEEMPLSTVIKTYTTENTSYLSFVKDGSTGYITLTLTDSFLNEVYNNNGKLTQIDIEYYFPTAQISDIFQLMQFLKYSSSNTSSEVNSGFIQVYKEEIAKIISTNTKKFSNASDSTRYGVAWADASDYDNLISCGYTADDIYSYSSSYLLLVEKCKCDDGTIVSYYSALKGVLTADLVLDKYTYNNGNSSIDVNIGWNSTQYFEFDINKTLDGQNHKITLVSTTYKAQEVTLWDVNHTPSVDISTYIAGGFVGINRGTLKNINFIFEKGSILSIANTTQSDYKPLDYERSIYAGLICAYNSGTIDSCTLTMEENTQVYVYKYNQHSYAQDNDPKYNTNILGGFTGLLGKGAIISNCTMTMGENALLILNSRGRYYGGMSRGTIYNYVGGFAGMMLYNSYMYNLKIEGAASSLLAAVACTEEYSNNAFNELYAGTGGVVGCNSSSSTWNPKKLGRGSIDGVIFNWKGACLNILWYDSGWGGSTIGGDRNKRTVTYYGGSCMGIADEGSASNFYYTFDISTFGKNYQTDFSDGTNKDTGIYIHNKNGEYQQASQYLGSMTYYTKVGDSYAAVPGLTKDQFNKGTYYTTRTSPLNINYSGSNVFETNNTYAICLSDVLEASKIEDYQPKISTKTLRVFELTNEGITGTGIDFDYGSSTTSGNVDVYKDIINFTDGGYYSELTTLGDALKWADKTIGSDIKCEFEVKSEDASAIMWSINIYGATSEGNKLITSKNTITEIPVYKFASTITEANEYKKFNYQIQRGEGDGMRLYYCTGNAAILSPDKTYYSNEIDGNATTYHPLKAVMYDGETDASNVAVDIYNQYGESISRLTSSIASNIFSTAKANGNIKTTILKYDNGSYVATTEDELKKIGSYMVQYDIYAKDNKGESINPNAYVSQTYRTEFFSSDGSPATAAGLVESYVIYIVIAPISIYITSIQKFYDGSDAIHFEYSTGNYNNSTVEATIDHTFTYVASGLSPTITNNASGGISLSSNSNIKLTIDGKYDSPEVGDRTATINMGGNITYSIYEYKNVGTAESPVYTWVEKIITTYYIKDKSGTTNAYFTLYELSKLQSAATESTPKEYYYYSESLENGYAMSKANDRTIRINQANPPTITASIPELTYVYTGFSISYGAELSSYITVKDSFGQTLDTQSLINKKELTITIKNTTIKDVSIEGYTVEIEIKYVGSNMTAASLSTSMKVYVTPAELNIDRVIKEYDKGTSTSSATFVLSGLLGSDTNTGIEATYASADVGINIIVNITTTPKTIKATTYNTLFENYYLSSTNPNVGIITPAGAEILNAYKTYDGTNTLSYSSTGTTQASSTLVQASNGEILDYKLSGSYSSNNVGQCSLSVTLVKFDYINAEGASVSLYRLQNSGVTTNYCIKDANSTSYSAVNIAYIVPAVVSVGYVYKEYDGTTSLGTFASITGLISSDSTIDSFDGEYATADVVYSGSTYNDVHLDAQSYTYYSNNGSSTVSNTVYRLIKDGAATNYMLSSSESGVTVGATCIIAGKGVIIPKLITLTSVTKVYDGKYRFDSSEDNVTATFNIDGKEVTTYVLTGKMSGKDATNGENLHDVILENTGSYQDYSSFVSYDGTTYIWLTNASNAEHNYRLASDTIEKVGDITTRKLDMVTGSTTSDGALSNLRFTTSALGTKYVASGTTYYKDQTYGTTNFVATLKWNGEEATLSNGSVTIDGTTMTFALDKTVEDAGTYTFTISMTSSQKNFEFTNSTFTFKINKQTISDASKVSAVITSMSKVYDGTSSISSISMGSLSNIKATVSAVGGTDVVTSWTSYTITSSGGINNSGVTMSNSSSYINAGTYTPTLSVTISAYNNNYTFSGTITNIYASASSSTKTPYTITKRALTVSGTFEKEFDGNTKGLRVDGVAGEVVELSYSSSSIKLLPGTYTGSANYEIENVDVTSAQNSTSTKDNYTVSSSSITVTIKDAKIAIERQYSHTDTGVNYFAIKLALLNLGSLDLFVDDNCTSTMLNTFIESKTLAEDSNADVIKASVAKFFVINVNDSPLWSVMDASQIDNILLYEQNISESEKVYTLELSINASSSINLETYTDRIAAVMYDDNKEGASTLEDKYCSNISVSSSELAEGQFSGSYISSGDPISTPEDLKKLITENGIGYLVNNIYGFDNASTTPSTFSGKLYGNGFTITLNGGLNKGETNSGLNKGETNSGFFVAINAGEIYDINFKFVSTEVISKDIETPIAVIAGTNSGTIKNCSLEMAVDINMEAGYKVTSFAGFTISNTGTLENVAITYSASISTAFSGIAATATDSSTINYVAVRENKYVDKTFENVDDIIGTNIACTIAYAIDAIVTNHTNTSATISKLYGVESTKLSMFSETYTNGYIDYYFAEKVKYVTNGSLHNVYETETDVNKTYYYGYNSSIEDYRIAIETIAPLNRFIWEAYDANYLTHGTSLNRAVALFDLGVSLQDSPETKECEMDSNIKFITSTQENSKTIWVTIFNPAIGIIAEAVISSGVDTVQEYEYTGSTISASFTATINEETKVLTISGTEVGVYTEYFEEANKEVSLTSREFDASTRTAKILSSSSGTGSATIMLIITPKTITDVAPTLTKQYDSTTIAETAIDTTGNSVDNIYAIGEYSDSVVGSGYAVSYYSYTRPVAAQLVDGTYKFIKCYLSGMDSETQKKIYTVKYSSLTSETDITSLNLKDLAREYNQLVTYDYLKQLESSGSVIMNYNELSNVTTYTNLTTAYIYDLAFGHTTTSGKVEYTSGIYYAYTMFNVSLDRDASKTINANYKWVPTGLEFEFNGTTLVKAESKDAQTNISNQVSENGGRITQRTVDATYSNLNQSYRKQLSAITVEIAEVSDLTDVPYSLTTSQYDALITAINTELSSASFGEDVLGATIAAYGDSIIKGDSTNGYFATNQTYAQVALKALEGNYSVSTNLAVRISGGATLTLRYFEYNSTEKRFIIDTIEALLKIDSTETYDAEKPNDYQTISYIVTNDINAKSKIITSFVNVFNGSINGNDKKILNMVLVGETSASLFGTLGASAEITNLSFVNTFVLLTTTGEGATAAIVANTNNASEKGISNVKVDGYVYSIASSVTISPIVISGSGKTTSNIGFVQTNMDTAKTTIAEMTNDTSSELVVMLRAYGNKTVANNIVNIYINGVADKTYANITETTQTFINACIINAPLTITSGTVTIENFRQYWAFINICPWLTGSNVANFIGYQFELNS